MNFKRNITLVALLSPSAVLVGACGRSDSGAAKSTTTSSSEVATTAQMERTTTISNDDFTSAISKISTAVSEAGQDPCKLNAAFASPPPTPGNGKQTRQLVDNYSKMLIAVAGSLPESSAENIKTLKATAKAVGDLGRKLKFKTDVLTSPEFTKLMSSTKVAAALSEFTSIADQCPPSTTSPVDSIEG